MSSHKLIQVMKSGLARMFGGSAVEHNPMYVNHHSDGRADNAARVAREHRARELASSFLEQQGTLLQQPRTVPEDRAMVGFLTSDQMLLLKREMRKERVYVSSYVAWKAYLRAEKLAPGRIPVPEETAKFLNTEIVPIVKRITRPLRSVRKEVVEEAIRSVLDELHDEYERTGSFAGLQYDDKMSPRDYEHFCAAMLKEYGWDATATKASGDQGADVTARKGNVIAVIQTKKYSSPVGNEAVQQVYAAQAYYGAKVAAVVATAGFTASARALARTTRVHLLHHDELRNFPTEPVPAPGPAIIGSFDKPALPKPRRRKS